jgi:CRISPR-associated exonuclease Cas4
MHSAKGLEWPVVIKINSATQLRSRDQFIHRPTDDSLHWVLGEVVPPGLKVALDGDEADATRERERLWYVTCTRARDLLVIPQIPAAGTRSWAKVIDLGQRTIPELDLSSFEPKPSVAVPEPPNAQSREIFLAEAAAVELAAKPIRWIRPSDHDSDRLAVVEAVSPDSSEVFERQRLIGAGRLRGLVLHKLMEEVLNGELQDDTISLRARAQQLLGQLSLTRDAEIPPDPAELAQTITKTLALPEITRIRPRLVPEFPIQGFVTSIDAAVSGRADAVELVDGRVQTVIDWKSDVAPTEDAIATHAEQLGLYAAAIKASRSLLVYMSLGLVRPA